MSDWTVIASPYDLPEAQIIAGRLRSEGFEVRLGAEHHMSVAPYLAYALNGIDVSVPAWAAAAARASLDDVVGEPADFEPCDTCPDCGSQRISRLLEPVGTLLMLILAGFPFGFGKPVRHCATCGRYWIKPQKTDT